MLLTLNSLQRKWILIHPIFMPEKKNQMKKCTTRHIWCISIMFFEFWCKLRITRITGETVLLRSHHGLEMTNKKCHLNAIQWLCSSLYYMEKNICVYVQATEKTTKKWKRRRRRRAKNITHTRYKLHYARNERWATTKCAWKEICINI